jgi:hypothetical protein
MRYYYYLVVRYAIRQTRTSDFCLSQQCFTTLVDKSGRGETEIIVKFDVLRKDLMNSPFADENPLTSSPAMTRTYEFKHIKTSVRS